MDVEIKLDGTIYKYVGGEWYEAETAIKPPRIIIDRLNQYLPVRPSAEMSNGIERRLRQVNRS